MMLQECVPSSPSAHRTKNTHEGFESGDAKCREQMGDKTWDKVFGDYVSGAMTQVATLLLQVLAVGAWAVL
jgi:hypothetical protein